MPRLPSPIIPALTLAAIPLIAATIPTLWQRPPESPTPAASTPTACLDNPAHQTQMLTIPAGTFTLGAGARYPEERPQQQFTLNSFRLSRTEVTNAQFAAFVAATGYVTLAEHPPNAADHPNIPAELLKPGAAVFAPPTNSANPLSGWQFIEGASWRTPTGPGSNIAGRDHFPVIHIAFADAQAYAAWKGHRLPTEAEHEYAARGGQEGTTFAWGDQFLIDGQHQANTWQGAFPFFNSRADGHAGLAPVGCYPPNGYGLHDMIGNVWEWTSTPYYPSHQPAAPSPAKDQADPGHDPHQPGVPVRVIKGGSYLCAPNYCQRYRPAARQAQDTGLGTAHIGFRTAQDL